MGQSAKWNTLLSESAEDYANCYIKFVGAFLGGSIYLGFYYCTLANRICEHIHSHYNNLIEQRDCNCLICTFDCNPDM